MRARFPMILLAVSLSACASRPITRTEMTAPMPTKLTVVGTANRYLEMEPCGCSMAPQGGLQRERNVLTRWGDLGGRSLLFFNAGTTFVPQAKNFQPAQKDYYRLKAEYLAQGLTRLGVKAFGPSVEDLVLGLEHARAAEKASAFPWVSANLYARGGSRPLFAKYHELRYQGGSIFVTGLSPVKHPGFTIDDFEARDPLVALEETLKEMPVTDGDLVVLLTSLSDAFRFEIIRRFPRVNVVLGGEPYGSTFNALGTPSGAVYGVPGRMGQSMLRIDLNLDRKPYAFRAASTRDPVSEGTNRFTSQLVVLSEDYTEPENDMTVFVEEFKEKVRGLALGNPENEAP